ncbi:MAG TPA: universal stress protein [Bryobacteraceae bacterium]|nr:universal stress protein [Bryobacteraceae bacterium]
MRSLSKILLPVDFSERSLGAARYARLMACRFGSELTLLHVLTPPHYEFGALEIGGSMLTELYTSRSAQVEKELDGFLQAELSGINVRRLVLEGDPARRIVEFAHQEQMGLIIMPTHGYGHFRRFILGSITAKVLHDADCPVWTGVHMEEAPPADAPVLREILCAIDLGPQSGKTLEWAAAIQKGFGARLTVIHVPTCSADSATHPAPDHRAEMEARVRSDIAALQEQAGTQAEVVIEPGDPPKVICGAAARLRAGLLVIGRGSAGGVFGRLRTNAYAIIRQSPCAVASV